MSPETPPEPRPTSARNSTDIPSHGILPEWLRQLSTRIVQEHDQDEKLNYHRAYRRLEMKKFFGMMDQQQELKIAPGGSFTAQLMAQSRGIKNIAITESEYIVPNLDGDFDLLAIHPFEYDFDMEKHWRSLDEMRSQKTATRLRRVSR